MATGGASPSGASSREDGFGGCRQVCLKGATASPSPFASVKYGAQRSKQEWQVEARKRSAAPALASSDRRVPDVVVGGIHFFLIHPSAAIATTATITMVCVILMWQHLHDVADLARSDMSFRGLV
jgi:hypothetical protein